MREVAKNLKDSHTEEKKTSFFFIEKIKFNCESIKDADCKIKLNTL